MIFTMVAFNPERKNITMLDLFRTLRGPTVLGCAFLLAVSLPGTAAAEWGQDWGTLVWGATVSDVPSGDAPVTMLRLLPNSPNPFNPMTVVRFELPDPVPVSIRIYSLAGRCVRTLLESPMHPAGRFRVTWDGMSDGGRDLASGVYLCNLESGPDRRTIRMVLVR